MIIAINASHFVPSPINDLINDHWLNFATSQPQNQFVFIVPPSFAERQVNAVNITKVVSAPRTASSLMWQWWLNYTLPSIAKKHHASIIIHAGGACSLRAKIPQCMFVSDLSYYSFPQFFSKQQLRFLKKNMPLFADKATAIIAASDHLAKQIPQRFPVNEEKVTSIPLVPSDQFQPIDWKEKEIVKEKYTSGKEYFLFSGEIHERSRLVNLLKAFSFFKTRQKSNMQLIITAPAVSPNDAFMQNFNTYKYRKEVTILFNLLSTDLAKITAAAYAFVYPVVGDGTAIFPLQAMQCEVPVISTTDGALYTIAGDAALYASPDNFEDLASKMMLVFKDELTRSELISSAVKMIRQNSSDNTHVLWEKLIVETIGIPH